MYRLILYVKRCKQRCSYLFYMVPTTEIMVPPCELLGFVLGYRGNWATEIMILSTEVIVPPWEPLGFVLGYQESRATEFMFPVGIWHSKEQRETHRPSCLVFQQKYQHLFIP